MPFIFSAIYYLAFSIIFIYCYYSKLYENVVVINITIGVLLILPIILFKPFSLLFDKEYVGTVIEIKDVEAENSDIGYRRAPLTVNSYGEYSAPTNCYQIVKVKTDKNAIVCFDTNCDTPQTQNGFGLTSNDIKNTNTSPLINYYSIDDKVAHYNGFSYNRKLNTK